MEAARQVVFRVNDALPHPVRVLHFSRLHEPWMELLVVSALALPAATTAIWRDRRTPPSSAGGRA